MKAQSGHTKSVVGVALRRFPSGETLIDDVVVEEPLEIRVEGQALAVLMRTPGQDRELVAGFLWTEGVVEEIADIRAMAPCQDPNVLYGQNTYLVSFAAGVSLDQSRLARARRAFFTTSSCGLCGKQTIDSLLQSVACHPEFSAIPIDLARHAHRLARPGQAVFAATGGLHAAALFDASGKLHSVAEDVGRHNAVDKVLGSAFVDGAVSLANHVLWVSGRASFELVQKALVAGIAGLVCVGAPSSLAVQLAQEARLSLVGFARGGERFNVYAGAVD